MRTKVIRIRIDSETENRIKNRAGSEGKSMAGTIRSFIEKSLDSGSESGSGIDQETIRKEVDSALNTSLSPPPSGTGSPLPLFGGSPDSPPMPASSSSVPGDAVRSCKPPGSRPARHGQAVVR